MVQILANADFDVSYVYGCFTKSSFYKTFATTMIVPLLLLIAYAGTSLVRAGRSSALSFNSFLERCLPFYLAVTFICYSPVSSATIKAFVYEDIEGVSYLVADYSIRCSGGGYATMQVFASMCLVVCVVGILASYVALLWHYHVPVVEDEARWRLMAPARSGVDRSLRQLWSPYRGDRWWFEVVECVHRVSIVAVTVTMHDEGASQIALVLVATVIFAYVTEIINPFAVRAKRPRDGPGVIGFKDGDRNPIPPPNGRRARQSTL